MMGFQGTLPVLLPHELLHTLHQSTSKLQWNLSILGRCSTRGNFGQWWAHDKTHHPHHPTQSLPDEIRRYMIPVGLHGDEVADVKDDKVLVLTWNSVTSKIKAWDCRFVFAVVPYREMVGRTTLFRLFEVLRWSLECAGRGVFPYKNHLGEPFVKGSPRCKLALTPLAGHWRMYFVEMRGDNEFYAWAYAWNHYRCSHICHRCQCEESGDMSWRDLRRDAPCFTTLVSTADFFANTDDASRSPLCTIPGWDLDRVVNDHMHGQNLGIDPHVCGNLLYDEVVESGVLVKERDAYLGEVWMEFNTWCKGKKISGSQKKFSMRNIMSTTVDKYPLLHGKAANTRVVLAFLAERIVRRTRGSRSPYLQKCATCAWAINEYHRLCEQAGDPFSETAAAEVVKVGWLFLETYVWLRNFSSDQDDFGWHLVPKHHYFAHTLLDVSKTRMNPVYHHCYLDEDMVGRVARGSRKVHRSTVSQRWFERYIHMMFTRWRARV